MLTNADLAGRNPIQQLEMIRGAVTFGVIEIDKGVALGRELGWPRDVLEGIAPGIRNLEYAKALGLTDGAKANASTTTVGELAQLLDFTISRSGRSLSPRAYGALVAQATLFLQAGDDRGAKLAIFGAALAASET